MSSMNSTDELPQKAILRPNITYLVGVLVEVDFLFLSFIEYNISKYAFLLYVSYLIKKIQDT